MARVYNLARMTTATTGTGTITLGSAVSNHVTFGTAGVEDGETISYAIEDGTDSEVGVGVYTASGTTLTRSLLRSTTGSLLNLSGNAQVFITPSAEDFGPGVNAQTGTSYTIVSADLGRLITFSNASPVAVTLPQATGIFKARWYAWLRNLGAGTVTITPTTSTIGGASTLVLLTNQSALIVSDGTNWIVAHGPYTRSIAEGGTGATTAAAARDALSALGVVRVQTFTSSGTYTPHADMLYCTIQMVGGGGGAGGVDGNGSRVAAGGGGGAGAYTFHIATASDIGSSQTVTIGAGGAAGTQSAAGGTGGTTSVGSLATAPGGGGGTHDNGSSGFGAAGGGGAAGTGTVAVAGVGGTPGDRNSAPMGGHGGNSFFGGAATGVQGGGGTTNAGTSASGYGSGGGGAATNAGATDANGGAGSAGLVIITEFCTQ